MALCAVLGILSTVPRLASADEAGFDWSKYDDPANYTETVIYEKGVDTNTTMVLHPYKNKVIRIYATIDQSMEEYNDVQFYLVSSDRSMFAVLKINVHSEVSGVSGVEVLYNDGLYTEEDAFSNIDYRGSANKGYADFYIEDDDAIIVPTGELFFENLEAVENTAKIAVLELNEQPGTDPEIPEEPAPETPNKTYPQPDAIGLPADYREVGNFYFMQDITGKYIRFILADGTFSDNDYSIKPFVLLCTDDADFTIAYKMHFGDGITFTCGEELLELDVMPLYRITDNICDMYFPADFTLPEESGWTLEKGLGAAYDYITIKEIEPIESEQPGTGSGGSSITPDSNKKPSTSLNELTLLEKAVLIMLGILTMIIVLTFAFKCPMFPGKWVVCFILLGMCAAAMAVALMSFVGVLII
jgi:hypothetical protein